VGKKQKKSVRSEEKIDIKNSLKSKKEGALLDISEKPSFFLCGRYRIRTYDPLGVNQVL
jgi:hypothetical protein